MTVRPTPAELDAWVTAHYASLDEAAGALGINRSTLWRWLRGKTPIPRHLATTIRKPE